MKNEKNIFLDLAYFIKTRPKNAKIFYSKKYDGIRTGHNIFFQHRTFTENIDNFSDKTIAVHPHGPKHLPIRNELRPELKRRTGHTQNHHFPQHLDAISTKNTCGVLGVPPFWPIKTPVVSKNKRGAQRHRYKHPMESLYQGVYRCWGPCAGDTASLKSLPSGVRRSLLDLGCYDLYARFILLG